MLYVGCANCRRVSPLHCSGSFIPHVPVYVSQYFNAVQCGFCGILPPVFTCPACFVTQQFMTQAPNLPFAPRPYGMPMAPVVQAPVGSSADAVTDLMRALLKGFASESGEALAQSLFQPQG